MDKVVLLVRLKKKVLLYNPKAVFYDLPLALIALASNIDREKYDPIIIDGRIEKNPIEKLNQLADDTTLCLGVTCLTGAPIKDALKISEEFKALNPDIPVIWGGWHTSLFALEPLKELSFVDFTVQGQGEASFSELLSAIDSHKDYKSIEGISYKDDENTCHRNKARATNDINSFNPCDYSLIDVEAYFKLKGRRQLDFISSAGCYFRCSFCADPFVFERKFTSLKPERIVEELKSLWTAYKFTDLNFQDETFFTYKKDILKMAELFIENKMNFSWAATMRADQGSRMTFEEFEILKKSGLRRLLIGVESGSQEMMDWLKKDIKMEQVWLCAERCKKLDINVIFPFIVGFPGESDQSVDHSIQMIKELRAMSDGFDTPIFYFKPYPGSAITSEVVKNGYSLPEKTEDWGEFDYIGSHGPWVSTEKRKKIERLKFYLKLAYSKKGKSIPLLSAVAKRRVKNSGFAFPIEKWVFESLRPSKRLS